MDVDGRTRARRRRDDEDRARPGASLERAVLRRDEENRSPGTRDAVSVQESAFVPVFHRARREGPERRMADRAGAGGVAHADRMDTADADGGHDHQGERSAVTCRRVARHVLRQDHARRRQPDRSGRARDGRTAATSMMAWLEATALATWTRESPSIWAYPTILTLHTVNLGIVVGANAVIDFRLLGFAPRLPIPSLAPLYRFMLWAFLLNAATGVVLFMSEATTKSKQPIFYVKLTFIALALWNAAVVRRGMVKDGPFEAPLNAPRSRRLAIASLVLWS